jgi:hypothetical protein
MAASFTFCFGKKNLNPSSLAFMAIGNAPRMGCKLPSRELAHDNILISIALICSDATRFQWLKLNHKQSLPSASLQEPC